MVPLFRARARADNVAELLDGTPSARDVEANLRDLAVLNRFGGVRVTRSHVTRLLGPRAAGPVTVLDVGSGGADIPLQLVRRARRRGQRLRIVAVDKNRQILDVGRRSVSGYPEISFLQADGLNLPVKTGSVDVVISSLTLHHLEPPAAPRLLAEMAAAARIGFVVSDLIRGRLAYALVWIATRLFGRSHVTRHDGPLSVLRAYSPAELRALARTAGVRRIRIVRHPFCLRLAVVGRCR